MPAQPWHKTGLACIAALVTGILAPALPAQAQNPTAQNLPPSLPALVTMLDRTQSPTAQGQMTTPTAGITVSDDSLPIAKGTATAYTVVLDSQPTAQVIVTANSSASGIATVKPVARSFTTDNWNTPQTFTVSGVATGTATITHALASSDDNYGESLMVDSVEANVTPVPTEIRLSSVSSVDESSGSTTITATLDNPAGSDIDVRLYTLNATAQRNSDYTHPSTFTIRKGTTTGTVDVSIVDDDLVERSEKVFFSADAGGLASYGTELTIVDDDAPDAIIAFGNTAATFNLPYGSSIDEDAQSKRIEVPITISHLPSEDITFDIKHTFSSAFPGPSLDYSISAESVTFSSTGSKSRNIEVTFVDNEVTQASQFIEFTLEFTNQPAQSLSRLYDAGHKGASARIFITDDDIPGVSFSEDALIIEVGTAEEYTAVLQSEPTADVTITPTISDDKIATISGPLMFSPANWNTAQTFVVTPVKAGIVTVTHVDSSSDFFYNSRQPLSNVRVGVFDELPKTLTLTTPATVAENGGNLTVTATFDHPVQQETLVTFVASGGTARFGVDYTVPATFTATLAIGETVGTATVTITDDDIDESDETFSITASRGDIVAEAVTVTITDDDTAGVTVSESELAIFKGSTKSYTVVLDSEPTSQVTITPTSGTLGVATVVPTAHTFEPGDWDTEKTFTVTGAGTGTSTITHVAASTDGNYGSSRTVDKVEVTVEYPPPSTLTVSLANTTVAEDAGNVTVTATLDERVNTATPVTFTATGGTATAGVDYTVPATFTGVAAKGQTFATATVTILEDRIDEGDETFTVAASAGTLTAAAVPVTIRDDDTAGVAVSESEFTIVKGETKTYTVVLESQPTAQVTVTPTSGTTSVATVKPAALTFTTSNWGTEQTFTVTGVETGTSNITHAATGDIKYGSLTVDSVEVTVENPPSSTLTITLTNKTVAENAGSVTITATLDQPANTATTITFTATSGTATAGADYTVPNTFTGVAAKGQSIATATVRILDDDIDEENETFTVAASVGTLTAAPVTVTIRDDDTAGVTVSEESLTVVKGTTKTYTVVLESQPTAQVTVTPTSGTLGVATAKPAALTFTTSNWNTEQTFTVTGVETGTSTVSHAATGDTKYGSLTVDSVEVTVANPPSSTLTVTLTNTTVDEDAGSVTITATLDQPANTATTITFTATDGTATAGTDYTVPATFTGVAAKGQSVATATVTILEDRIDEGNETFTVAASAGSINADAVTVTIRDDDTAGVTVSEESLTVVKGATKTYTVVLESQPTAQVTVTPTSGTTSVATVKPAALTFTTSNWNTEQTFTVTGVETGTSNITHAATGDAKYGSLTVDSVEATVENPPSSTLTVTLTNTTVDEDAGSATITATLDQPANTATTITFTATSGTATAGADYTVPATFTGVAAKGQSVATATMRILDDDIDEENETFTVAASAGTLTAAPVTVTITDNDTAGVTVSEESLTVVKGATKTYTVVLESQPTAQVTVTPTSGTLGVATVKPAALTFTTSNWNTEQTFTVTGVETGTSNITHAATGDTKYGSLTVDSVEATVANPPSSTLTITLTNTTV